MDESFGEFECRGGELSSSWAVIIEASNVEHILRRDSWNRPTIISNAGEATVTTTAFNDYEEWLSFRKEREAEEARLEEKRIVANAKAAAERDRRAHLAAEARRIENDRIYQAQQVLLKNLGLGTETHCGMVIDLREGLVEVQTEVVACLISSDH